MPGIRTLLRGVSASTRSNKGEFPTPREGEIILGKSPSFDDASSSSSSKEVQLPPSPFDMTYLLDSPSSKSSSVGTGATFLITRNCGEGLDSDEEDDAGNVLLLRDEFTGSKSSSSCLNRSFLKSIRQGWIMVKGVFKMKNKKKPDSFLGEQKPSMKKRNGRFTTWRRARDRSTDQTDINCGYDYMDQSEEEDDVLCFEENQTWVQSTGIEGRP